jgi:hypothetical protein
MTFQFSKQHDVLAEIVRPASAAREQCFTWGPQQHQSTYNRIVGAAMRYSTVVNYAGAVDSPSAPPSVVLELHLDSDVTADACHPCRRLLGSDGTAAGPAHLRATTVCSPRRRYF